MSSSFIFSNLIIFIFFTLFFVGFLSNIFFSNFKSWFFFFWFGITCIGFPVLPIIDFIKSFFLFLILFWRFCVWSMEFIELTSYCVKEEIWFNVFWWGFNWIVILSWSVEVKVLFRIGNRFIINIEVLTGIIEEVVCVNIWGWVVNGVE